MLGGVTAPSAPEFHRRTSTYTRPPGTSHVTQLDPRSSLPSRLEDENVTQIAGGLVGRPPARQLVSRTTRRVIGLKCVVHGFSFGRPG
jgi:hypothetical protein